MGVCAGLVLGRCAAGEWRCDTAAIPGYGAETCDYRDNDCDGETDEGFSADAHLAALERMAALGVTWNSTSVPGDSLEHAIEAVERYGAEVIGRPS